MTMTRGDLLARRLTRLSRLLRILRFHAHDLKLVPRKGVYRMVAKGRRGQLQFSKTGESRLEAAYATHLVWPGKGPFHLPGKQPNGLLKVVNQEDGAVEACQGSPRPAHVAKVKLR